MQQYACKELRLQQLRLGKATAVISSWLAAIPIETHSRDVPCFIPTTPYQLWRATDIFLSQREFEDLPESAMRDLHFNYKASASGQAARVSRLAGYYLPVCQVCLSCLLRALSVLRISMMQVPSMGSQTAPAARPRVRKGQGEHR